MGIITARFVKSKLSFTGLNLAGISLGKAGYEAGGLVSVWAVAGAANNAVPNSDTSSDDAGALSFMICPPESDEPFYYRIRPRSQDRQVARLTRPRQTSTLPSWRSTMTKLRGESVK